MPRSSLGRGPARTRATRTTVSARFLRRGCGRVLLVVSFILGVLVLAAPAASAHIGGGAAGSDFDGRLLSVEPPLPGVSIRVLQFGDQVELVNDTDDDVLVPGYSGEPYLRIGPQGVWRNQNSPATYLNLSRYGTSSVPDDADPEAAPEWLQVSSEPAYLWHDHRTHWMTENRLPPVVAADPSRGHTVSTWEIPLEHAGSEVTVTGELTWTPPPSPGLVWPGVVAVFLVAVAAGWWARSARPLGRLLLIAAAGSVWHVITTPEPPATVSSHAGAIASAALPAALLVAAAVLGLRASRRAGRGGLTGWMAIVVAWLLLAQGLPDMDVLWTANVLPRGPETLARAAVGALLGLGTGLLVGGIGAVRRFRGTPAIPAS